MGFELIKFKNAHSSQRNTRLSNPTLMSYFKLNVCFFSFTFCLLLLTHSGTAQTGKFDVQFAFKKSDCVAKKITLQLQVRSHSVGNNFLMGDANFRFDYDSRVIANPKITLQPHYSILGAQGVNYNYGLQNLNGSSARSTVGRVSLQCFYTGNNASAEKVDTGWTSVACLEFDLINSDSCLQLKWHTGAPADFPNTGMSEVLLLGNGNYNTLNTLPGDFFNFNYCVPNKCSFIIANNDFFTTTANTTKLGNLVLNDTSANTKIVNLTPVLPSKHGIVTLQNNGNFSYVPTKDFVGTDSFVYSVCNADNICSNGTVYLTVNRARRSPISVDSSTRCIDSVAPVVKFINPAYAHLKSGDTITANCVNPPIFNASSFTVSDNYDKNPAVAFKDLNRTIGTCSRDGYKILMQCDLIANDSCGNRTDFIFFVKIIDTTPPTLSSIPADITVNNSAPTSAAAVTATDDCGTATVSLLESSVLSSCGTILTRTWLATDECGNVARKSQKITINNGLVVSVNNLHAETCAKNDGTVNLTFLVSTSSYQITSIPKINWKPATQNTQLKADSLKAGTYSVTITSTEGCTKILSIVIADSCPCVTPVASLTTVSETCSSKNGTANLVLNKSFNYNIGWSNGITNSSGITNLSAGSYSVTISNINDATCKQIINFVLANDASNCCKKYTTVSTIYVTSATCNQNATACTEIPFTQIANYNITDNGNAYSGLTSNCNNYIGLSLGIGNHNVVFKQKTLNCSDSLFVKVICPITPTPIPNSVPLAINVNETATWCLSNIPLLHPVKIINLCPASSGAHALINIIQSTMCVTYKGIKVGTDSACLKIISSTNDTNYVTLIINVKAQPCANLINQDSVTVSGTCNANGNVPVCLPVSISNLQGYTITIDGAPYTTALAACSNTSTQFFVPVGFHNFRFSNSAGCSDSVNVGAACVKSETIITELRIGGKDTMCIASNTLLGRKYYLQNLCAKQSGKVDFNLLGGTTCIERFAKTVGSEKACYILCDEYKFCDTTYIIVNVSELKAKQPVAIDDNVKVLKNTTTYFNVILNDSFGNLTPALRIIKYPLNGLLTLNTLGEITYKPSLNYCGADVATYEICTAAGCATANINFKVSCDNLVIYSAFSPNNDGVNDFFTIEGIDKLTNSTVSVFNRWGNEVFAAKNYKNNWGGTWNGTNLPEGTYFYIFNDGDGNTRSGYVEIQR